MHSMSHRETSGVISSTNIKISKIQTVPVPGKVGAAVVGPPGVEIGPHRGRQRTCRAPSRHPLAWPRTIWEKWIVGNFFFVGQELDK